MLHKNDQLTLRLLSSCFRLTKKYKESEGRYESSASVYEQELFTKDATLSDVSFLLAIIP